MNIRQQEIVDALDHWRVETDPVRRWAWMLVADTLALSTAFIDLEMPSSLSRLRSALLDTEVRT